MKKKSIKNFIFVLFLAIFLISIISFLGVLFDPNLAQSWGYNNLKFEEEKPNSIDVLFFGSSYIYCSFSPMEAFNKKGITSYIIAGPEQSMNMTYDNLIKSLETQKPKIIFVEIKGLTFFDENLKFESIEKNNKYKSVFGIYQYNKLKLALSGKRVENDNAFYNFFTFHNKWKALEKKNYVSAIKYILKIKNPDILKGYVYFNKTGEDLVINKNEISPLSEHYEDNIKYLDQIYKLCKEENIELILLSTPNVNINFYDNYIDELRKRYSNVLLLNLNDYINEVGIDLNRDMYDWGHPNFKGAVKITDFLVNYLNKFNLQDKRENIDFKDWLDQFEEYKLLISK